MSSGINARERLEAHRSTRKYLRLFALVDGLVFEKVHGEPMKRQHGCIALFDGTPDAPLAAAGPWLGAARHAVVTPQGETQFCHG